MSAKVNLDAVYILMLTYLFVLGSDQGKEILLQIFWNRQDWYEYQQTLLQISAKVNLDIVYILILTDLILGS